MDSIANRYELDAELNESSDSMIGNSSKTWEAAIGRIQNARPVLAARFVTWILHKVFVSRWILIS